MRVMKCWWAGQVIRVEDVTDMPEDVLAEKSRELKVQLQEGALTQVLHGHTFVLEELCIDILEDGAIVGMHNFKKK